jgi:hypothetical protein
MAEKICDRCGNPLPSRSGRQRVTLSLNERPRELKFSFLLCHRCSDELRRIFMADPLRKLTVADAIARAAAREDEDGDLGRWPRPARVDRVDLGGRGEGQKKA